MKKLFSCILLLFSFFAVMAPAVTVQTLADVSGDGASHAVAAAGTARWIQFVAPAANSGTVRVGDSNISTTRGVPLAAGAGFLMPSAGADPRESMTDRSYTLSTVYYLVANGDKVSITWGK